MGVTHFTYSEIVADFRCLIKSRMMRWVGHVTCMEKCKIVVGKPEEKRQLRRPRCRWGDNIKMDLREIGLEGVDWINRAHDSCCEFCSERFGSIKGR
jgi:hypothetical protein